MRQLLAFVLCGTGLGCSPIPELAAIVRPSDVDAGEEDAATGGFPPRPSDGGFSFDFPRPSDFGGGGDMGPSDKGPCPQVFGASASFCYWPTGPGPLNLSTALALAVADVNCDVAMGRLSVNAAGTTCAAEFAKAIPPTWGFSMAKPVRLAFSYSVAMPIDYAILTVNLPSGSMNEALKVSGISGQKNVVNLSSPAGTDPAPGFTLALGGAAKRGTVTFDWISIWQ